jgi:hypothetical protein
MTTNGTEHFATTDLGMAAYLIASGFKLLGLGSQGQRREFQFDAAAAQHTMEFYSDGPVKARSFASAIRDLKTLLREA